MMYLASRQQFLNSGSSGDSINAANPVGYYKESGISATSENDPINTWVDSVNGNDLVTTSAPTLHIGSSGKKQVRFDGISQFLWASSNTIYDFTPQTDEFSIVVKLGDTVIDNASAFIGKGNDASGGRQYELVGRADRVKTTVGGIATTDFTSEIPQGNDLIIMTVSTTTVTVDWNGTTYISGSIGTGTNSNKFTLAARGIATPSSFVNCDVEFVAIYDKVLSTLEKTNIVTEYNVN